MKLLLKQYLSALKERDELDAILPEILSESGFSVVSRPKRGTTQDGVDVAAVGPHPVTGIDSLYLFSIKSGNLTRSEWNSGDQALRPSLEQILDNYISTKILPQHQAMPKLIVLCFGGEIHENIRKDVRGFTERNTTDGQVEFLEWNGDHLADLIAKRLLNESIFPESFQVLLRKALAFVDEPDVSERYFVRLIDQLFDSIPEKFEKRIQRTRQALLATQALVSWSRDSKNLESAQRCAAYAVLQIWEFCKLDINGTATKHETARQLVTAAIGLHVSVMGEYCDLVILPYNDALDGLSANIPSADALDINLGVFQCLGRLSLLGLWHVYFRDTGVQIGSPENDEFDTKIHELADAICKLIRTNGALENPIRDDHAIEINLALMFLELTDRTDFIRGWVQQTSMAVQYAYMSNQAFPCTRYSYEELARHPVKEEGYKQRALPGSVLFPTLAFWLSNLGLQTDFESLSTFRNKWMPECTWQFWFLGSDSEKHFFKNSDSHGLCLNDLGTDAGPEAFSEQVLNEVKASWEFLGEFSAMQRGLWPLVFLACLTHRLPVPPHFWAFDFMPASSSTKNSDDLTEDE